MINALDFKKDEDTQTLGELYKSLHKLSEHIVDDNIGGYKPDGQFPFMMRKIQLESIKALVSCIEETLGSLYNEY
jgi:hypothetical protein